MEHKKTDDKPAVSMSPSSSPMTTDSIIAKSDFLGFEDWSFPSADSSSTQRTNICNSRKTTADERMVFLEHHEDFCNTHTRSSLFCIDLCDNPVIISQNAHSLVSLGEWNSQNMSYSTISGSILSDMAQLFHQPNALLQKTFTIVNKSNSCITAFKIQDVKSCDILNTALRLVACVKI